MDAPTDAPTDAPEWTATMPAALVARAGLWIDRHADPADRWRDWQRALEAGSRTVVALHPGWAEADNLERFLNLSAHSRYAVDVITVDPDSWWDLIATHGWQRPWGRAGMARELASRLAVTLNGNGAEMRPDPAVLGQFRNRHQLRIILGDLSRELTFEQVVSELSDLADVLIASALTLADASALAVLALGKLGGRELNYSSDIDLIFAYEPAAARDDSEHQRHCRRAQEVIRLLEHPGHGRMFRVDMRLRPEGDNGQLVLSRRETVDYYYSVGRSWERQALIKARCCGGDRATGQRLLSELAPWIFPVEPQWDQLDEARSMRRRIEERAQHANLKTAAGGIRDIEFLCQYFQLLYGGDDARLRSGATLPALRRLRELGVLPRPDADQLERDYIRLRTVEHRLQMWDDRQIHDLPADASERTRLAWRCGANDLATFDSEIAAVRRRVRHLAERHFLEPGDDHRAWLQLVIEGVEAHPTVLSRLAACGLRNPAAAVAQLRDLAREPFFLLTRDRTERALVRLAPLLLNQISTSPDPDATLTNIGRIAGAVGGRATFFDLLASAPDLLRLVSDIAGWSGFLVDLLVSTPGLADELSAALARGRPRAGSLFAEARHLCVGLSNPAEPLHFIMAREQLAAAAAELRADHSGSAAADTQRHLTATAQAITGVALRAAVREAAQAWGVPMRAGRASRLAVLAAGKAGCGELGYVSDLDVVFVSDDGGTCPRIDRDADAFWQRVVHGLTRTLTGSYEIDARLRPWGDSGPLITTWSALEMYWADEREMWERLALMRVSVFTGDPGLGAQAVEFLRRATITAPLPADAVAQVRHMRQRLEQSVHGHDNLKRGPGGYVDIEFIAQFRLLGADPATIPVILNTADLLAWEAQHGRIPAAAAPELTQALRLLRHVESRQRLSGQAHRSDLPFGGARTRLATHCGFSELAAFEQALAQARLTARTWFERLIA